MVGAVLCNGIKFWFASVVVFQNAFYLQYPRLCNACCCQLHDLMAQLLFKPKLNYEKSTHCIF